jgi:hypothetical protein
MDIYDGLIDDYLFIGNPPKLTSRKEDIESVMYEVDMIVPKKDYLLQYILKTADFAKVQYRLGHYKAAAELYLRVLKRLSSHSSYTTIYIKPL